MCVVSMISDHYMEKFPDYRKMTTIDYREYEELLRKAREYDRLTNQPDCQDPKKAEWERRLKDFMEKNYELTPKEK